MSSRIARLALAGYKWGGVALYPVIASWLQLRTSFGKEDEKRRPERYGYPGYVRPEGPLVWVHAASVGETIAVIPLIREICNRDIHVILTTGTVTSAKVAASRLGDTVIHQYVPVDILPAVRRFLNHWNPDLAIIAESEIWPVTMMELGARHIPQILVNARLSDRSHRRWSRQSSVANVLFDNLALVLAQSEADAEKFRSLGSMPVLVSGNLKVDGEALSFDELVLAKLKKQIGERKTWAAISTFEGEENVAGIVHQQLKDRDGLLTIIVPRHPERCDAIEKMLNDQGLLVARRTRNDPILPETDVYLGDTIGEMGLYLRLTNVAFVGRSLCGTGGQNPMEPAMLGCAVLSGSNVQNFRESYQNLARNGGAKIIRDVEMLIKGVHFLLNNHEARDKMIVAGRQTVEEMSGALAATVRGLEPYINPLTVKARLQPRAPMSDTGR